MFCTPSFRAARVVRLTLLVATMSTVAPVGRAAGADQAAKPKTGEFTTTFADRSPLSAPKVVAQRLGVKAVEPADYGLATEPFVVWVPDDYAPERPHGVVVLMNYKATAASPEPVLPLFKERHLIFVAAKAVAQPAWVKAGLAVDAVHNLKRQYAVDDARVYLLSFDHGNGVGPGAGQLAALAFADVFTGSFHSQGLLAWKPMRAANGGTYKAKAPVPVGQYAGLARTRPIVLAHQQLDEYRALADRFVRQDGFRQVKTMTVSAEQAHYPNYTADWLTEVLTFLDDNRPKPPPAKPAPAKPATASAARPTGGAAKPAAR